VTKTVKFLCWSLTLCEIEVYVPRDLILCARRTSEITFIKSCTLKIKRLKSQIIWKTWIVSTKQKSLSIIVCPWLLLLFTSFDCFWVRVMVMVFKATVNKISILYPRWQSVLLVGKTGVLGVNHRPATSTDVRGTEMPPPFFLTFCLHIYFQ
jgi:hypothetical protein